MASRRAFAAGLLRAPSPSSSSSSFSSFSSSSSSSSSAPVAAAQLSLAPRRHLGRVALQRSLPLGRLVAVRHSPAACAACGVTTRALGPALARGYSTGSEGKPSKIWDFEGLQKLVSTPNPSVTIIDVREPSELQQTGRIPGAINIPVKSAPDSFHISEDEFEDRFGFPRPPRDAEVIFYCKAGVRSRGAAGLAKEAGWTNVGEYPGSWLDWSEKGGKVEK